MAVATYNPEILKWAMKRAHETPDSLVTISPFISKWIDGTRRPTLRQLQLFAERTHITFGSLFARDIPTLGLQIADFRTPEGATSKQSKEPSPELYDTINQIMYRQDWMHNYFESQGYPEVPLVGCLLPQGGKDPESAADILREQLKINEDWAFRFHETSQALTFFKDVVEKAGVSVAINGMVNDSTNRLLDINEFRGFVLSDRVAPIIFINGRDAKVAQIFTLAHELVHLGFSEIGVVSPDPNEQATNGNSRERICDFIAASLLLPHDLFYREWHANGSSYSAISETATSFKVSFITCARRGRDFGLLSQEKYRSYCRRHQADVSEAQDGIKNSGGGNYYSNKRYRLGSVFGDAVYTAVRTRQITYTEAFSLTGMNNKTFTRYFEGER